MLTLPNCSTSTNRGRKGNSCLLCSYPQGPEKAIPASSVLYPESSIGARKGCPKIPPVCAAKLLQPELLGSSQGLGAQCPQAAHLYSPLRANGLAPTLALLQTAGWPVPWATLRHLATPWTRLDGNTTPPRQHNLQMPQNSFLCTKVRNKKAPGCKSCKSIEILSPVTLGRLTFLR